MASCSKGQGAPVGQKSVVVRVRVTPAPPFASSEVTAVRRAASRASRAEEEGRVGSGRPVTTPEAESHLKGRR